MTEQQIRAQVVATAKSYLGCNEANGSHKKIIDLYNSQTPLPVGYKVKYTDAWCATFVSAVAVKLGLTSIILPECGCGRMIELYKKAGRWMENDAYVPQPGDVIFYNWNDDGKGDCVGEPDHVGYVCEVSGSTMTLLEGNKTDSVSYRTLPVNGRYIRGYGLPDYAAKADKTATPETVAADPELEAFKANWRKMRAELQDNDASDYSKAAREWAVNNGIIAGASGEEFNGMWEDMLTREQMATVLYRFAKLLGRA